MPKTEAAERVAINGLRVGDMCYRPQRMRGWQEKGFEIVRSKVLGVNPDGTMVAVRMSRPDPYRAPKPIYGLYARTPTTPNAYVPGTPNAPYDAGCSSAYASLEDAVEALRAAVVRATQKENERRDAFDAWIDRTVTVLDALAANEATIAASTMA